MKRLIDYDLKQWVLDQKRKPLLLRGARQIGKTYAARQLGKSFDNFVEINFEEVKDAHVYFEGNLYPEEIIHNLSLLTYKPIIPGKTLLFFDEIQAMPRVLTALRYFYEKMPELHVIAAGSLLDFTIQAVGIPVGRVESLYMYPLSFFEFLLANEGGTVLVEEILRHSPHEPMNEPIHKRLLEKVSLYVAIGGMPEAVQSWIDSKNALSCAKIHTTIIDSYRSDFGTYAKKFQIKYVDTLFKSVPGQLGDRFKYSKVEGDYRKRELSPCLDLLVTAGVIHRSVCTAGNGIPLGAEVNMDYFKLILADVALTQAVLDIPMRTLLLNPISELINRGSIVEAFVGQELLAYSTPVKKANLYYWQRMAREGNAEVDYLVQDDEHIIPIEVKSAKARRSVPSWKAWIGVGRGSGSTLASMHSFLESHQKSPHGIRFSTNNYSVYNNVHSYPLYAIAASLHSFEDLAKKITSL